MITLNGATKINNDVNGNPRYVFHFVNFLTGNESASLDIDSWYGTALARAKKYGGKKYHNKGYGGGIVFSSYALESEVVTPINRELMDLVNMEAALT